MAAANLGGVPVVLSQHFSAADRVYLDVEGSLYHFPRVYFNRVKPYDRFVYYRPLGGSARRADSLHYFGHGVLGVSFEDPQRPDHRFVDITRYEPFPSFAPLVDLNGNYYETGTPELPQMQSAVREISEIAYYKILAAANVRDVNVSLLPNTEEVAALPYSAGASAPKDALRELLEVPAGAGYVPRGSPVDVYESAALQERARADHQRVLTLITSRVRELGGQTWYNNNIDLLASVRDHRLLVEAKSLNDARRTVDRMRYGMGQLFDYRVRYKSEIGEALPVLAFGRPPTADASWIARILEGNGIAFISSERESLVALNEIAEHLPFFS